MASNVGQNSGNISATALATGTGDYTVSAWVLVTTTSGVQAVVNNGTSGTNGWSLRLSSGGSNFVSALVAASSFTSAQGGFTNQWQHLALVSNSGNQTLYFNGSNVGTGSIANVAASGGNLLIGKETTGVTQLAGEVADVAVWTSALNSTQIQQLFGGYRPPDVVAPQWWWPLGGYQSPEPELIAGNNGTVTSCVPASAPPSLGRGGRSFTGTTTKMTATTITAAGSWTIACWALANSLTGTQLIVYNGNTASNGFGIRSVNGANHIEGVLAGASNVTSTTSPVVGNWGHYAFVNA